MSVLQKTEIEFPTGTLEIATEHVAELEAFCDFAARANPKRGFLIVSKVLGRHLPASPADMRRAMDELGQKLPADLPGPIVVLGMAETATALGQGVFASYLEAHGRRDVAYLQSSRQIVDGANLIASFEEGHSHATTHLIQVANLNIEDLVRAARTLVIVDDECSTGNTYVAVANAMLDVMPDLELVATCCITDWSGERYIHAMPRPTLPISILAGAMEWKAADVTHPQTLAAGSNIPGRAPRDGMRSRSGLRLPEHAIRSSIDVESGERILVLGEGEHSYEALLVAEEIEQKGGVAAVQCITRSPVLLGFAMQSKSTFSDSYGSGAPCFLYNILRHKPDRVLIVAEQVASQAEEARAALQALGSSIRVEVILCSYAKEE